MTNPDNVGGLRDHKPVPLSEELRIEAALQEHGSAKIRLVRMAQQAERLEELCRAAPAGGDDQKEYEMDKTIYELAIQCGAYVDGGDIPDHSTGFPGSEPTFEFTERQLEAFVAKLREQRVGDTRPLTASDLRDM